MLNLSHTHTVLGVLQLSHDLLSLGLLRGCGDAEGSLASEGGAVGIEGGRDPALLLPLLLALQTRSERTAHRVTQTLALRPTPNRTDTKHSLSDESKDGGFNVTI